jgi:hypothetical protein
MQLYGKIAKIYVWGIAQSAGDAFATPTGMCSSVSANDKKFLLSY